MNARRYLPLLLSALALLGVARATAQALEPTDRVRLFNDLTLRPGEQVRGDALCLMGDVIVEGGATQARVGRSVLAVAGDVVVNGAVHGSVLAVGGDVFLGPAASVDGDVVVRGGHLHRDPKASVGGTVREASLGASSPAVQTWGRALAKGQALVPSLHPLRLWCAAGALLGLMVLGSLVLASPVRHCRETLIRRPGLVALAGVFGLAGVPVLFGLLALSVVGIPLVLLLVPLCAVATLLIGGTAILAAVGQGVGGRRLPLPASVAVGGAILIGIALVPYAGLPLVALAGFASLGAVVGTLVIPSVETKDAAQLLRAGLATQTLTRASFGLRMVSGGIDLILVATATAVLVHFVPPRFALEPAAFALLFFTLYSAAMWRWNGATVGALLCGIRIIRADQKPMDWSTSLVRVLGSQLSLAVFGLGFLTVGVGQGRLAWHDRMAGTLAVMG